jgi:hypothetical protein
MPHYYITTHSDERSRWTRFMHCPPIADNIFVFLTPATLINLSLASKTNTVAIQQFYKRAYNIHRHLSHFFHDPQGFRSLQARSGTLISGSNALQFLQRSTYKDSDLDLYTHPGYASEVAHWLTNHERYTFVPVEPSTTLLHWNGLLDPKIHQSRLQRLTQAYTTTKETASTTSTILNARTMTAIVDTYKSCQHNTHPCIAYSHSTPVRNRFHLFPLSHNSRRLHSLRNEFYCVRRRVLPVSSRYLRRQC